MTRLDIPNGFYVDALPSGEYACLLFNDDRKSFHGVQTHLGLLTNTSYPFWLRINNSQKFKIAGQSNNTKQTVTWMDNWKSLDIVPCGSNPIIYDSLNNLLISDCSVGSQGYRYIDWVTKKVVTGDQSLYDPISQLHEYTNLGDGLLIGQGQDSGCLVWDGTNHRLLEPGNCEAIRANRVGNNVSVSMYHPNLPSVIFQTTMDELRNLPVAGTNVTPIIPVAPATPIPIVVTHQPIPPKEIKMIAVGSVILNVKTFEKAVLQSNGSYGLLQSNGKWASLDSFGNWSERDAPSGGDEQFYLGDSGNFIAPNRGGHTHIVTAVINSR